MIKVVREFIEVSPGSFKSFDKLTPSDKDGAIKVLRAQLRELLGGLAGVLGRDVLIDLCRRVIDEDKPSRPV
jgi:hypothetical protein